MWLDKKTFCGCLHPKPFPNAPCFASKFALLFKRADVFNDAVGKYDVEFLFTVWEHCAVASHNFIFAFELLGEADEAIC